MPTIMVDCFLDAHKGYWQWYLEAGEPLCRISDYMFNYTGKAKARRAALAAAKRFSLVVQATHTYVDGKKIS